MLLICQGHFSSIILSQLPFVIVSFCKGNSFSFYLATWRHARQFSLKKLHLSFCFPGWALRFGKLSLPIKVIFHFVQEEHITSLANLSAKGALDDSSHQHAQFTESIRW